MVVFCGMGKTIQLHSSMIEGLVQIARRYLSFESAFSGDGYNVAGTVEDANNHNLIGPGKVIDCIFPAEDHAQVRSEMRTRCAGKRKRRGLAKAGLDLGKKIRSDGFRCFFGEIAPYLR
jgi:hypothetical protein